MSFDLDLVFRQSYSFSAMLMSTILYHLRYLGFIVKTLEYSGVLIILPKVSYSFTDLLHYNLKMLY